MRCLKRNKQHFYFCQPVGDPNHVLDDLGHETGEQIQAYSNAKPYDANISPSTGIYRTEEFGSVDNYDNVIVTDDPNCPINESTVLFVGEEPTGTVVHSHVVVEFGGRTIVNPISITIPVPNYVVWRVSRSLNVTAVAIRKAPIGIADGELPYPIEE